MLIGVRCKCGRRLKVTEAKVGQSGHCPACKATLCLCAPGFTAGKHEFEHLLVVTAGPQRGGDVILLAGPGSVEIGKLPDKHIVLAGKSVSRGHCRLVRSGLGWRLEDQRSTNGVFVNGQRIQAHDLQAGDTITIGEYTLRFASSEEARPGATALSSPKAASAAPTPSGVALAVAHGPTEAPSDMDDAPFGDELHASGAELEAGLPVDDGLYALSDGDVVELARPEPSAIMPMEEPQTGGPTCPSCGKSLAPKAKICITCGVDLKTGRAIITSHGTDTDAVYANAEAIVRWVSWFIWLGLYPVASEGFGLRKPYFTRAIVVLTVLVSAWFWAYDWTDSPKMASVKNYMLWVGDKEPTPWQIMYYYQLTTYGDSQAFEAKCEELGSSLEEQRKALEKKAAAGSGPVAQEQIQRQIDALENDEAKVIVAAHQALPPDKQFQGRYAPAQLITHAFLHADIMHLIGNMLFLMVIGSRINALVGNLTMVVLYPVLAVCAGVIYMASQQGTTPHPCVGASGAIMGLCGMYLVLMPIHRIHMAGWWRLPLIGGFALYFKLWAMRGFWVVLFYIMFDVVATVRGSHSNVAHWAHLGGFIAGMAIGSLLLFTRLVNCRGGDAVSGLLGQRAWAFVGKPDLTRKAPLEYGW